MIKILSVIVVAITLSGCAHQDLQAPCKNIAALAPGSIPCDQREPINTLDVPSVFARP